MVLLPLEVGILARSIQYLSCTTKKDKRNGSHGSKDDEFSGHHTEISSAWADRAINGAKKVTERSYERES